MNAFLKTLLVTAACTVPMFLPAAAQAELVGPLTVVNQSAECVEIFYNGRYIGTVHEGDTTTFRVHDHRHVTTITAFCEEDHDLVARAHWHGHRCEYVMVVR
jgi:hypothetical protein